MVIIVVDTRERISLCGMEPAVFLQLTAIIRLATRHRNPYVRAVMQELHLNPHWILHATRPGFPSKVTLAALNWEEVFTLTAVITELLSATGPCRMRPLIEEILLGLDAAVESSLRRDNGLASGRFHR